MPESAQLADDLETLSGEFEGRFLAGLVDIDAVPQIAQAMQIPSVPLVVVIVDGRPMPAAPGRRTRSRSCAPRSPRSMQQLTAQGITGRHQPRTGAPPAEGEEAEEPVDPRYAAAQDALGEGDIDRRSRSTRSWSMPTPPTPRPRPGWRWPRSSSGPRASTSRRPARPRPPTPTTSTRRSLVADLDMLGGHVDDAFNRLVELVRRTEGDDRNQAREHLLALFAAVGNDDPRVLRGRQNLASALF